MNRLLTVYLFLCALMWLHAGPVTAGSLGDAVCPESCVPFCSDRAVVDTTWGESGGCYFHVGYDIPAGTLFTLLVGGFTYCFVYPEVKDDFVVQGLAPGTPVTLTAALDFSASWQGGDCLGGSGVQASITEGSANRAEWNNPWNPTSPDCDFQFDSTLTVIVQATAGTPFRMTYRLNSIAAEAAGAIEGTFYFTGLPPGVGIRSCNGYMQDYVPIRPVTWGSVKALYR